jgi:hypothetical protein
VEIELDLRAAGTGPSIPPGRVAERTESCSDESLRAALGVGNRGRTAEGQELHAAVRRDAADDVLLAQGESAD